MGKLSDKVGRKPLYVYGTLAMALYALPYFWLLHEGSNTMMFIATIIGLGIIWSPITAVLGTMFLKIFATEVRYTGISLGYQIGATVAGGTAPLIAAALLLRFDDSYIPGALYIVFTALVSLVAIWAVRDLKNQQLDEQRETE